MEKITLKAEKRENTGKALKLLRQQGIVPAVVYGKEKKNLPLALNLIEFEKVYREVGTSRIIKLSIPEETEKNVLIQEIELDPVKNTTTHVDFYEVSMKEKITTEVPLNFIGDSRAVIELSGSLITSKTEVEVESLPADLPQEIEVDISVLDDFDKAIHVKDLKVAPGVEIKADPEEVVAVVEPPRSEEEMAELEEPIEAPEAPESEHGEEPEEKAEEGEAPEAE